MQILLETTIEDRRLEQLRLRPRGEGDCDHVVYDPVSGKVAFNSRFAGYGTCQQATLGTTWGKKLGNLRHNMGALLGCAIRGRTAAVDGGESRGEGFEMHYAQLEQVHQRLEETSTASPQKKRRSTGIHRILEQRIVLFVCNFVSIRLYSLI